MNETPKVYAAIAACQAAVAKEGISKDRKNEQQGYRFRGIDDIYNAVAPLLSSNGLCIMASYSNRTKEERQTKSGGTLFYVTVEGLFDFVSTEDGSKHTARFYGEAMDSGDKATNKAMSCAYKYACLQTFCIPTEGDNDADSTTHEVVPHRPSPAPAPPAAPPGPPTPPPPASPKPKAKKQLTMATSGTRAAALDRLGCQQEGQDKNLLHAFLVALGWLENEKAVEQWPIRFVPISKEELESFQARFAAFKVTGKAEHPYAPHGLDPGTLQDHPVAPPEPAWCSFVMPFGRKGTPLGKLPAAELESYIKDFQVMQTHDVGGVETPFPKEMIEAQKALRAALDEASKTKKG